MSSEMARHEALWIAIDRLKHEQTISAYSSLSNLLDSDAVSNLATIRVGIVRNFTIEPLIPIIRGEFARCGFVANCYLSEFDTVAENVLNPHSALYSHDPELIVIANWLETLSSGMTSAFIRLSREEIGAEIERIISHFRDLITAVRRKTASPVLINNFPLAVYPTVGILDAQSEFGHTRALLHLNAELSSIARSTPGVYIVDYFSIFSQIGLKDAYDERSWQVVRAPLKRDALLCIGREYSKYLRAIKGLSRKCLVLDCDNTLWGGVIGEDGIGGIKIGSTYPGSGFKDFQAEILNLYHRGVFLALCSKNNEADVVEVFDKHPEMVLKTSHFSATQINWDNKATNLERIARALNIGLDSLVFVDDSEFECRWVQQQLPQVETLLLQGDASTFKKQLSEKGYFDSLSFTEEDKRRSEMFLQSSKSELLRNDSGSYKEYLLNLGLLLEIGHPDSALVPRISQLTQKTNQFNLTTVRYSEGEIAEFACSTEYRVYYVKLKDRFVDFGLIGIAIVRLIGNDTHIDSLALSCRALGRGVEKAMVAYIMEQARDRGNAKVYGKFRATAKNDQVANFYRDQDFELLDSNLGESNWVWNLTNQPNYTYPEWIKIVKKERKLI